MFKQFVSKVWVTTKKVAITVKVATVYFVQGVVKSLVTSLCILAGVNAK